MNLPLVLCRPLEEELLIEEELLLEEEVDFDLELDLEGVMSGDNLLLVTFF